MGRPCTICSHPQRNAINHALAAGHSYRDVGGLYAVSKTTLHRHWGAHVADEPVSTPAVPHQASGTAGPPLIKLGLWVMGILGLLRVVGRTGQANLGET